MSQTEQLNIQVTENGSSKVAEMLRAIADEARAASKHVSSLRKAVGGRSTVSEARKGGSRGASSNVGTGVDDAKKAAINRMKQEDKVFEAKRAAVAKSILDSQKASASSLADTLKSAQGKIKAIDKVSAANIKASAKIEASDTKRMAKELSDVRKVHAARRKLMESEINAARKATQSKIKSRESDLALFRRNEVLFAKGADKKVSDARKVAQANIKLHESELALFRRNEALFANGADKKISDARKLAAANKRTHDSNLRLFNRNQAKFAKSQGPSVFPTKRIIPRGSTGRVKSLTTAVDHASLSMRGLGNQVFFAQRAFAALGGALAVSQYLKMSDQFQNMENRIRLVTDGTNEFNNTQATLQKIARKTRQSLSATVETYVRLRKATLSSGLSSERLFGVMSTLNKMLAVSGATANESEQAMRQLSQAFSKGKLDGDEFRTLGEAMPDILTALQQSLGVTEGELRKMSEAGQLTTEVMVAAFEANKELATANFDKSIATIGQAWQVLKDNVLKAVGSFNNASGMIGILVDGTLLLADNLWIVGSALKALAAYSFVRIVQGLLAASKAAWGLAAAMSAANSTNFIGPLTKSAELISKVLGPSVARLTMGVGALGAASLIAGAAFAGVAAGTALDKALGISDALADSLTSITDSLLGISRMNEVSGSSREEAINNAISLKAEKIKQLEKERDIQDVKNAILNITDDQIQKEIDLLNIQNGIYQRVLDEIEAKKIQKHEAALQKSASEFALKQQIESKKNFDDIAKGLSLNTKKADEFAKTMTDLALAIEGLPSVGDEIPEEVKGMERIMRVKELLFQREQDIALIKDRAFQKSKTQAQLTIDDINAELEVRELSNKTDRDVALTTLGFKQKIARQNQVTLEYLESNVKLLQEAYDLELLTTKLKDLQAEQDEKKGKNKSRRRGRGSTLKSDISSLLASLDPIRAAAESFNKSKDLLDRALERKIITNDMYTEALDKIRVSASDVIQPVEAMIAAFKGSREESKLSGEALELFRVKAEIVKDLLAGGMTQSMIDVKEKMIDLHAETVRAATVNDEYKASVQGSADSIDSKVKRLKDYKIALAGIKSLEGDLSAEEKALQTLEAKKALYPGVVDELDRLAAGTVGMSKKQLAANEVLTEEIKLRKKLKDLKDAGATDDQLSTFADEAALAQARLNWELRNSTSIFRGIREELSKPVQNQLLTDAVTNAYMAMEDIAVNATIAIQDSFADLLSSSGDSWKDFTGTLEDSLRDAVNAMLADITRLLIRMALVSAINGGGGLFGVSDLLSAPTQITKARHGGTIPKFAHGGGFQVGGTGGPDTKLVQFMASPGENVHVTNPGQSRLDNRQEQSVTEQPSIVVNNIVDPNQAIAALSSPQGVRVIKNIMIDNAPQLKRFLNQG